MEAPDNNATGLAIVSGLRQIGYEGPLLRENYSFADWFAGQAERQTIAAAFAQTPVSYETACIGLASADGLRGPELVSAYRALGAPILLEIDGSQIREWAVARTTSEHVLIARHQSADIGQLIAARAESWEPVSLFRAKNIGWPSAPEQGNLFAGLLPELESEIERRLDPLLNKTMAATSAAYFESTGRHPKPQQLFRLVFRILTGKVFHDRQVTRFASLEADADAILAAVAKHYKEDISKPLNREARQTAAQMVWSSLDFRNLSVEVLAHIWSTTLVDPTIRKHLGIHRTPRTVVKYVIEHVPFSASADDSRIVFEPCCGSAAFLIGALNKLRSTQFLTSSQQRHQYFIDHLAGIEIDPFGAEISRLALTLADFPNSDGWNINEGDALSAGTMTPFLNKANAVLCNPPFESLNRKDRAKYGTERHSKPERILNLVLDDLHPSGSIGFVLPLAFLDGQTFRETRARLTKRFGSLEVTALPDKVFEADSEIAILVAKDPIPHAHTKVWFRKVYDGLGQWAAFERQHKVGFERREEFGLERATLSLRIPELMDVWQFLEEHPKLGDKTELHRGIRWNKEVGTNEHLFVRSQPAEGFQLGVPPRAKFDIFQVPTLAYLSFRSEHLLWGGGFDWQKPKAILNKSAKSRGRWRISAFPDRVGLPCFQTFLGVWPRSSDVDEVVLAAVLNGPIANAFVATREGKTDVTVDTLKSIPMPVLTPAQIRGLHSLVQQYQGATSVSLEASQNAELLLKHIDAMVLDGYHLPPSLERQVLDYFSEQPRRVGHTFSNYFPRTFDVLVSLSKYLDPKFNRSTVGELRRIASR